MKNKEKTFYLKGLLLFVIFITAFFVASGQSFASETQGEGYKGIIFNGENVCSVYVGSEGQTEGVPHQYYWVDTGSGEAYDLYCAACKASFGRGFKYKDGYFYIYDFDNISGGMRHFVFDEDGNKIKTETCQVAYFDPGNETHGCVCKCHAYICEEEHTLRKEIKRASIKENGFYATFCEECKEQIEGRTIYRPKNFSLSTTKTSQYNGKKAPKIIIKSSTGKTIPSRYYKVKSVSGSKKSKKFQYKIVFSGEYKGTVTVTFKYKKGKWIYAQ